MENLIQGKRYHIPFIAPYTSKGPYDVEISAITKKAELPIYGDFDIRGTFFDEVGIKTYLTMVTENTDIYICHPITSYDPLEVDVGTFIFIPSSIIDYNNIDEYLAVTRYRFEIEGIRRYFETSFESNNFVEELNESIPAAIMEGTNLANDVLNLTNTQEDLLVLKSVIEKEEIDRESYIKIRENNKLAMKKAEVDREMNYIRRMKELEEREAIVRQKEKIIDRNVTQSEESKVISNAFLQMTNDYIARIKIMYETIISRSAGINLPTWNELLALLTINQDPNDLEITLQEWKAGFESYISGGTFPEEWKNLEKAECPYCNRAIEDDISKETTKSNKNVNNTSNTGN